MPDGCGLTEADTCSAGVCVGEGCGALDEYTNPTCNPTVGCVGYEFCNGMDNDGNGVTDDVTCGGAACVCNANGSSVCPATCTVCPNRTDVAIPIDDDGESKVICARGWQSWGPMSLSATTQTLVGSDVVRDSLTGLDWQRASSTSGLSQANAQVACNDLMLDDSNNWRPPTLVELTSIVEFGQTVNPTIGNLFSGTASQGYWSASAFAGGTPGLAAFFADARQVTSATSGQLRYRCVRDTPGAASAVLNRPARRWQTGATALLVVDRWSQLAWSRYPPSTGGDAGFGDGRHTYAGAVSYCADLTLDGYDDWRLPSLQELTGLVDHRLTGTRVSPYAFPSLPTAGVAKYWTTTANALSTGSRRTVDVTDGSTAFVAESTGKQRVLCVRSLP